MTEQFYHGEGYQQISDDKAILWRFLNGNLEPEMRVVNYTLLQFKIEALIDYMMDMSSDELKKQTNELLVRLEMQPVPPKTETEEMRKC